MCQKGGKIKEMDEFITLPCGIQGINANCFNDCIHGRKGDRKKIEMCYTLLKRSREVRNEQINKQRKGK